jgi:formamidopyrimidine-DNA glycosylase
MTRNEHLLTLLNKEYGDGSDDAMAMLEDAVHDSVCPGICRICETCYEEVEPDTTTYWCEQCQENSVTSCLVLAGLI